MQSLTFEVEKAGLLPVVAKVIVAEDYSKVAVELRRDLSLGLKQRNILYFLPREFSANEVEIAIGELVKERLEEVQKQEVKQS
jgi:hypothetical protein